ncbi:MAG: HD domain-containing protein, partial [Bacilli bacterium]
MQTKVDELLQVGKFLPVDLVNAEGVLIVKRDTLITESNIQTIRKHSIQIFDKLLQHRQQQRAFKVIENYEQAFDLVKSCFEEVRHRKIEQKLYKNLTESFSDLLSGMIELKQSLDVVYTLKDLDDYTFRHSVNVGLIAAFIGRLLRLPETDVALLGQMGLLHDIG